jgi:hypothetical protein
MKMVKSLILGSAAGLIAVSGAQAADLPVKAKAVEYVRICSLYGAGFFYIPGTDTCIKLGGALRIDSYFNAGISTSPAWSGDLGQGNRYRDYFDSRSRMVFNIDTRTATEYGVVRTFGQTSITFDTLGGSTYNPNAVTGAGIAGSTASTANLTNTPGGGFTTADFIFIQFAGFTFGKSASAFSTPWHGFPGNNTAFLLGGHDTVNGTNNIQYTAQFGNGVSGTIGLDESVVHNRTAVLNAGPVLNTPAGIQSAIIAGGVSDYAGQYAPDIVGNIRVDQAWGLFQISAAAHQVNAAYNTLTNGTATAAPSSLASNASELSGHPESKWGGAVSAALQIKNIPTGAGDDLKLDATWATGDTKQVISSASTSPSFLMFGGSGRAGAYQSIGIGQTADAIFAPVANGGDGQLKLINSWGVRGAFNHNWDPYWSTSVWGSATSVSYGGSVTDPNSARGIWCAAFTQGKAPSADYNCNPSFNTYQVGLTTRWTPVKNLTFSAEVGYFRLDQKMTGAVTLTPSAPKPTAVYEFKDQDTVSVNFRAQRNF